MQLANYESWLGLVKVQNLARVNKRAIARASSLWFEETQLELHTLPGIPFKYLVQNRVKVTLFEKGKILYI